MLALGLSPDAIDFRYETLKSLRALDRIDQPFFRDPDFPKPGLSKIRERIEKYEKSRKFDLDCANKTRIFYLKEYFMDEAHYKKTLYDPDSKIQKLLTRTPFVYVSSGEMQDGTTFTSPNDPIFKKLHKQDNLISYNDRVLARRKVVCTPCMIYAKGGYGEGNEKVKVLSKPQQCIMLSVLGAQLDDKNLDYRYFIEKNPELDGQLELNQKLFFKSLVHDVYLWFHAFNIMVMKEKFYNKNDTEEKGGLLRLCKVGAGFFADVPGMEEHQGKTVSKLLLLASILVIKLWKFDYIDAVEFLYFDEKPFKIEYPHGSMITNRTKILYSNKDILDIPAEYTDKYYVGITNPSDSFSMIGNEFGYDSVEAMLGNNTSLRLNQVYHWNGHMVETDNYIGVDLPTETVGQALYACNHKKEGRLEGKSLRFDLIAKNLLLKLNQNFPSLIYGTVKNDNGFWSIVLAPEFQTESHKSELVEYAQYRIPKSLVKEYKKSSWYKKKKFNTFEVKEPSTKYLHVSLPQNHSLKEGTKIYMNIDVSDFELHDARGDESDEWKPYSDNEIRLLWATIPVKIRSDLQADDSDYYPHVTIACLDAIKSE